jgi:hypothetical protein
MSTVYSYDDDRPLDQFDEENIRRWMAGLPTLARPTTQLERQVADLAAQVELLEQDAQRRLEADVDRFLAL